MDKQEIQAKQRARKLALQALYQWLMAGADLAEIDAQFRVANDMARVDLAYFCRLLYDVPKQLEAIESAFTPFLDRPIQGVNPVELTVLRLSAFELLYCPEVPYRVVLNEAVVLSRAFGSQEGHRYVNGVLNNLARQVRALEIQSSNE